MAYPKNDLENRKGTVDSYSPQEVTEILSAMGMHKKKQHIDVIILKSFLAGVFLSFSGLCEDIECQLSSSS